MPSLTSRTVDLSSGYVRATPIHAPGGQPIAGPIGRVPPMPTPPPFHVVRSPLMLSSVPMIAQSGDGPVRQFYSGRALPVRRIAAI